MNTASRLLSRKVAGMALLLGALGIYSSVTLAENPEQSTLPVTDETAAQLPGGNGEGLAGGTYSAFNPEADNEAAPATDSGIYNPEADPGPHVTAPEQASAPADGAGPEPQAGNGQPSSAAADQQGEAGSLWDEQAAEQSVHQPSIPLQRKLTMKRELSLVVSCEGDGVCREQKTGQPLRVLPKSFSHVYKSKSASTDNIAIENIAAYKALYVLAREELDLTDPAEPLGWYQVSHGVQGPAIGWMQASDVLEWKQALIVSYRHRGVGDMQREPVLMFRSLEALQEIVESPVRDGMAMLLYQNIQKGDIPPSLASREPERYVDIDQSFYLLPILDFEVTEIDGDEVRYLQVAAAVPQKRGADVLQNQEYRQEAETEPGMTEEQGKAMQMDIVFVMDMSRSMQPYIDSTRDAISELVRSLATDEFKDNVRFGLVGYRDDTRRIPALQFTSKNFTPALVDVDSFIQLLDKEARATTIGSIDYAEEVFAGVDTGLGSAWTKDAMRFLFLVGDASAHEEDHEQSTTGKNAEVLSLAARKAGVRVLALHLLDPRMQSDHPIAQKQFTSLSQIEGSDESALVQLPTDDKEGFSNAVKDSAGVIYKTLAKAREGSLQGPVGASEDEPPGEQKKPESPAERSMEKLMDSALVEYLGKEQNPPKDIVVWTLDRDISNPILNAMDVRVLLNKDQLSDLIKSIDQVTKALARAEYSHQQFFAALQSVAGQALKQPDAIDKADMLIDTGLLPSFIQSLPYKSEILSLSDEMYAAMTAEQRSALESNLRAKLRQYQDINEQVDGWVSLNEADEDATKVYPLFLDYLP